MDSSSQIDQVIQKFADGQELSMKDIKRAVDSLADSPETAVEASEVKDLVWRLNEGRPIAGTKVLNQLKHALGEAIAEAAMKVLKEAAQAYVKKGGTVIGL